MEMELVLSRRELLAAAAALTVTSIFPEPILAALGDEAIPQRTLGRTGEKVSLVGLGGFHVGTQGDEKESIRIIRSAIDSGITFMDNCWDYNGGASEERMGKALGGGYRQKVFLMSKIDGRDRATAAKQIEESLRRLRTDRIDLMQIHEVIRDSDPELCFRPGGAMEALLAARKAGKIRYIGFTGHKSPAMHLKMLEAGMRHDFTFDAVQLPLNVMDAHFDSFEKKVLPLLLQHRIGVLGMKSMGDGVLLKSGVVTAVECLQYAMSLPVSVVITGCDSLPVLQQAVGAARGFRPLREAQVVALLSRTAGAAKEGAFERYKTSQDYDGTFHNPEWLGPQGG